jgi:hypothetical protein
MIVITSTPLLEVADSILYVASLLADQPRSIDTVIDYFGDTCPRVAGCREARIPRRWRVRRCDPGRGRRPYR